MTFDTEVTSTLPEGGWGVGVGSGWGTGVPPPAYTTGAGPPRDMNIMKPSDNPKMRTAPARRRMAFQSLCLVMGRLSGRRSVASRELPFPDGLIGQLLQSLIQNFLISGYYLKFTNLAVT